jgi:hypothetical protein
MVKVGTLGIIEHSANLHGRFVGWETPLSDNRWPHASVVTSLMFSRGESSPRSPRASNSASGEHKSQSCTAGALQGIVSIPRRQNTP